MISDIWPFVLVSIPTMIVLGIRHGLDVDHITAIDNLVRLHNAGTRSRWVGAGFSTGHMVSVLAEMIFIISVIGSVTSAGSISFFGGVIGAIALGIIGAINLYSIKKWGKSGSAILASKILGKTGILGPVISAMVTGLVFGLGFDTATQISAITLSAVASATAGVQIALVLAGFFALGMIPVDTFDRVILRSAFSRTLGTKGFRYISYGLSGTAITVASLASFQMITKTSIMPEFTGPVLAVAILSASFGYAVLSRKKRNLGTIPK